MKKSRILLLLAAATVMASCQKNEFNEVLSSDNSVISAIIDGDNTKTTLDGVKVCWIANDAIAVNKAKYLATPDATDGRRATFTLTSTKPLKPATAPDPIDGTFCAYYPYDANKTTAKGKFILPSTQNYSTSNPLGLVNPMYAESESLESTFHFKNVCGLLTLDLKGEGTVSDITISANEYLAGILTNVAISDKGELTYSAIEDDGYYASKSVSLGCGKTATLDKETARRFYIALPEGDFTGVKLAVTTDKGKFEVPATKTVSIKKNNIYHLPEMTIEIKPLEFDAELTVDKCEVTPRSTVDLQVSVIPTDKNVYYIMDIVSSEEAAEHKDMLSLAKAHLDYLKSIGGTTLNTLTLNNVAIKGDMIGFDVSENPFIEGCKPGKDYVFYTYAVDEYLNISEAITCPFSTPAFDLPTTSAAYDDYLGEWVMGTDIITVEQLENNKTYKVTGISGLNNDFCTIPYVTASFEKGNFVLNEQYTGKRAAVGSYGDCDFYLSGIKDGYNGPEYPFNGGDPSMILYGQYSDNKITVYSSYAKIAISWIILSGEYEGQGSSLTPATLISGELKHPETMPADLFGEWKVTDGYLDGRGKDRTGWTWTLSQDGAGVKIYDLDPMLAAGLAPTFIWDAAAKTLTLPAGTPTGYGNYGSIDWYGAKDGYPVDLVLDVDLDHGVISLANDAYLAMDVQNTYTWYDAPLEFHKVASASASAPAKAVKATSNLKKNLISKTNLPVRVDIHKRIIK